MENVNNDLVEKPNHAHYPICRGRMADIESDSHKIFFCTLGASVIMAVFSFMRIPMHLVGWIPMIFNIDEIDKGAFNVSFGFGLSQVLGCTAMGIIGALGLGKRKNCHVIMLAIYAFLFFFSLFIRLSAFDAITLIISIVGVYYCRNAFRNSRDYKQLSETEGFPLFNTVLADNDDQKDLRTYLKSQYEKKYSQQYSDNTAETGNTRSPKVNKPQDVLGNMPQLDLSGLSGTSCPPDRFKPKSGKEGDISFSPLKL